MRRLLCSPLLLACAISLGCGDDSMTTAATASTSPTTAPTSTATQGETSSTGTATTSPTSTTSTASSGPSTTDPSTSGASVTTTSGTSGTSGTNTDGTSTTAGTTAGTTGGGDGYICESDDECTIINDCCACDPHHVDEPVDNCDIDCLQPSCDAMGIADAKAVCRFGRCTFAKITCNPLGITCKAPEPDCPPPTVASVVEDDNGKCWTGSCVPAETCDWVPDCTYCGDDLTCVTKLQKGAYSLCEPLPPSCDEAPATCACAEAICESSPPHTVCHDLDDSLGCECPNC